MKQMIRRFLQKRDSIIVLLVLVAGIMTACLPLRYESLQGNYYPDLGYHLIRIEGVKEAILAGEFPARIYNFALSGWGYGGSMFYQDYLLYIPALLCVLGMDIVLAYKVMILLSTMAITCTTYSCAKYISKSRYAASLTTIAIVLSQYYLADIYNRAGVSEYFAFIFVPILIAGVYDTLAEDCKHPQWIGIGLFGLLLTHSITFALGVVLLLVCFALNVRRFITKPYQIIRLLRVAVVTVLATAFIYVPLLEQMFSGEFHFHHPWANVEDMTQPIATWFRMTGYFNTIAYVGVGVPVLFCICLRIAKRKLENRWADKFIICGVVLIVITSKIFPWKIIGSTVLDFIQFPYRLYSFAIPILTIGLGMLYAELFEKKKVLGKCAYIFLGGMIAFCGFWQLENTTCYDEELTVEEGYFDNAENTFYIGAEEWLPANIKGKHLKERERLVLTENGQNVDYVSGYNEVSFETVAGVSSYEIPLLYYKGYEAWVRNGEGTIYEVDVVTDDNYMGDMIVLNPMNYSGILTVKYIGTTAQKVSLLVSFVTLIGWIGYGIMYKKFKDRR